MEALWHSISLYTERDPLVLAIYALQPAKVVTGDVSVSALPGRAARREIPRGRGVGQRDDDRFAQIGAVQGARCEVLCTEQRLLGGGLPGHLFGVLCCKARMALGAMGGCDGDGAPRREARGLGSVVRDLQHLHGPGRGWWALASCW